MKNTLIATLISFSVQAQEEVEVGIDARDGKLMYEAWCGRCHGSDGKGEVEGIELDTPVPDFTDCSFTTREPRKDWMAVIMHGGPARGLSMTMPAWGEAISEEQAVAIVGHIKTFCSESDWPQGDLNFRRAQITSKAFPENEALVIPTFTGANRQSLQTKLMYESRIGPAGQWEISIPFASRFGDPAESGIGDVEIAGKYAFFHDLSSMTIVSFGLEAGLPTGSAAKGLGSGIWKLSPYLAAAKGIGSTFLQTSLKVGKPLRRGHNAELSFNLAWTIPLTDEKRGLFPGIELNGITVPGEPASTLFITPQLYIGLVKRGHIAWSTGVQIPVAGDKPFDYRIVSFLLWEYADGGLWW